MRHALGDDVIISSEYIKVMFKNHEGIETVVYELANRKLGKVSKLFKGVLRQEDKGQPVRESLKQLSKQNINSYLKRLVSALVAESKVEQNLAELSEMIVSDRNLEVERLTRRLELVSDFLLFLPHIALLIPLIDIFNGALSGMPEDTGLGIASLAIPEIVKPVALVLAAVVITGLVIVLRVRK